MSSTSRSDDRDGPSGVGVPAGSPSTSPPGASIAERVVSWQRTHGRQGLPWQGQRDPYRVWLSEIMLQQTQVSTVLGYYPRFLARFPDVGTLAAAPLDAVLAAWSGMGYYSRARNLHRCAQQVMAEHAGRFPAEPDQLAALPGIGRSTAAAIAAFCFDRRAAILDGNVKRVLARVLGFGDDLAVARHERLLWQHACALLPEHAADMPAYTQGLMDLGATVCLTRRPNCLICPLQGPCIAFAEGRPEAYPVKTRTQKRGQRENWWLWLEHEGRVWLQRRPATGVWAGLWSLPMFDDEERLNLACQALGLQAELQPVIEHALTHFDWVLHTRRAVVAQSPVPTLPPALGSGQWVALTDLPAWGLPAPLTRLLGRPLQATSPAPSARA